MGPIPFAFSVHHFINSVGSDAGFASIIGLAILVLLYFAQARETSSLREQAYELGQRIAQLEARIVQLTRQQQAPPPPLAAAAATPPAARPVAGALAGAGAGAFAASRTQAAPGRAGMPAPALVGAPAGAPAGVAAPALTAATKLIPTAVPAGAPPPTADAQPVLGAAGAPADALDLTTIEASAPATVAGGANGHSAAPEPVAAVSPSGRADGSPPPRIQIRPGGAAAAAGRRSAPPLRSQPGPSPSRMRRVIVGLLVLLAVGVVVGGLLILTSGGSSNKKLATNSTPTSNAPAAPRHKRKAQTKPAAFNPASVTVAVLNGTATNQLAHRVALKLDAAGYKQGPVTTAADQTHTATVVAYMPGHQRDATKVAASLNRGPASVQPIDASTQAVVCPTGTPCTATVVVTVGSDLANIQ